MRRMFGLILIAMMLVSTDSQAADVPVSYAIDFKAFKREAAVETEFMFVLYSDPACTNPVHSEIAVVGDITLLSQLKLVKPKGGARPPRAAEIRHVLTGVLPGATSYLRVVGSGIAPVGPECQAQVAGAAGPQGDVGPAGPEGPQGIQGPAGSPGMLTGYEMVSGTGVPPLPGWSSANVEVQCPPGKIVIGGGFAHANARTVNFSAPVPPDRWRASCLGTDCSVTAYAICVDAP